MQIKTTIAPSSSFSLQLSASEALYLLKAEDFKYTVIPQTAHPLLFQFNLSTKEFTLEQPDDENNREAKNYISFFSAEVFALIEKEITPSTPFWEHKIDLPGNSASLHLRGKFFPQQKTLEGVLALVSPAKEIETAIKYAEEKLFEGSTLYQLLLSNLAQRIRDPLSEIYENINQLKNKLLFSNQIEELNRINETIDETLISLNGIVDYAILSDNQLRLEEKPFSLKGVIQSLDNLYSKKATQKGLSVFFEKDKNLPFAVSGDRRRFIEVLSIVIDNAIKFTDQGLIRVKLTVEKETDSSFLIKAYVRDTGRGIAEHDKDRIFYSFSRSNMKREDEGLGLGLTLAKKLITLMKGAISVESEVNKGSTFKLLIPFLKLDLPEENFSETDTQKRKINILLAEDNLHNQILMEKVFQKIGYSATIVGNGAEAIDELSTNYYDLVILDIEMPVLDGLETIREIRTSEMMPGIPVWALTSHRLPERIEEIMEVGFDDYLAKPVSTQELKIKIQRAFPDAANTNTGIEKNKLVSLSVLEELGDGDEAFITEMLQSFVVDVPDYLNDLKKASKDKDPERMTFFIHKVKSPFYLIGYTQLEKEFSFADNFEDGRDSLDKLISISEQVQTVSKEIIAEIKELLKERAK